MIGLSLDTWTNIMLSSLGAAAFAAAFLGVSTYAVVQLQKQEAADAQSALEQYKVSAKRDFDIAIGEAQAAADVKINKARDDANIAIEQIHQQNLVLEKTTVDAKLEQERLKAQLAWRTVLPDVELALKSELEKNAGAVNVRYTDGDPEALFLALQYSSIFAAAHWQVGFGGVKFQNTLAFGLFIPGPDNQQVFSLRKAFNDAKIPFDPQDLPPIGMGTVISTVPNAPILMVGSKKPDILR